MNAILRVGLLTLGVIFGLSMATLSVHAAGVVGTGSPASCDANDLAAALQGGGLVTFNCGANPHTIIANTYVIQEDTVIRGNNRIRLDGESLRQLFLVENNATLTLEGIILQNGESGLGGCASVNTSGVLNTLDVTFRGCRDVSATIGGGAVYNLGTFNATRTLFESNSASEEGGAILNRGTFNGNQVTFEGNSAGNDGGALLNEGDGVVVIIDGAFIGNTATRSGGAMINRLSFPDSSGSLTVARALFVDNHANDRGGAIINVIGDLILVNVTFFRNMANEGGAIFAEGLTTTSIRFATFYNNRADTGAAIYRPLTGVVELSTSILAGGRNEADNANQLECDGPSLTTRGYNLIDDGSCVDVNNPGPGDRFNTPPQLGPLQDNGGFSQTLMPEAGSPALEKVPADRCIRRDQRTAQRVGACDIGAVERGGLFISAYLPRLHR